MGEVLGKFRGQGRDGQKKRSVSQMFTQLEEITYFNRSEIKKWYKLFLKDCPDGHLKEERFVAFYTASFQSGDLERKECLAKQIFRTFDRDGSGTVDFREFMCGMSALLRGTTPERLKWAFNMYDLDGNGEISMQELLHVLKLMYELRSPDATLEELELAETDLREVADKIFKELDEDGDGNLQCREFVDGLTRMPYLFRMADGRPIMQ
ncbi:neurocalcin homolog [Branchiostoma floridae x Branchiostoma japonicum]